MSRFYILLPEVVDGEIAYADDVNDINNQTNTAFAQVASELDNMVLSVTQYVELAKSWAVGPLEDYTQEVEPGLYASKKYAIDSLASANASAGSAVASAGSASQSATSAGNSLTYSNNSSASAVASEASRVASGVSAAASLVSQQAALVSEQAAAQSASDAQDSADEAAGVVALHAGLTGTAVHGLGTASVATLVTSTYDLTVGRALVVGYWGIGGTEGFRLPAGTTAQRGSTPEDGEMRYNEDIKSFEGYIDGAWGSVGGGASGAPQNPVFYENDATVIGNYTITTGKNAMTAGPITVADGVVVTVPSGSTWTVV